MNMSDTERKEFAKEVVSKIINTVYDNTVYDKHFEEAAALIADFKKFLINANVSGTAKLTLQGKQCTKKEAKGICMYIEDELCFRCVRANAYGWPYPVWFTVVEMLKLLGIESNKKFKDFINFLFVIDIKTDNLTEEANFIKKLELISSLGTPSRKEQEEK